LERRHRNLLQPHPLTHGIELLAPPQGQLSAAPAAAHQVLRKRYCAPGTWPAAAPRRGAAWRSCAAAG